MNQEWVDLTQDIYEGMSYAKIFPSPSITTFSDVEKKGINATQFTLITHIGTHVDAPLHFIKGGRTIDSYPVSTFFRPGVVMDVTKDPLQPITASDLSHASPKPNSEDILLLRTGYGAKFGSESYFDHPYLAEDAAEWIVNQGISIVGIDAVTVDLPYPLRPQPFSYPVHHILLGQNVLIIENLADPISLIGKRVTVACFPIKIRGADGAQARVVARPIG